jgi:hypothetical protein
VPLFLLGRGRRPVQSLMAASAEGNQVQIVIVSLPAAQLLVVDLQVLSGTTDLAFPVVPTQYLFSEVFVELGIKLQTRSLGSKSLHEAFSVTSCRKACRCSPGRNLKNRDIVRSSMVGSSFSRFAPARKSAQIISRQ